MKYLKTYENSNSSNVLFTQDELSHINKTLDDLEYILKDEGYSTSRLPNISNMASDEVYRYRFLVYKQTPDNFYSPSTNRVYSKGKDFRDLVKKSTLESDEFNEFVDRLQEELGDDYLVYIDSSGLLFVVIEKNLRLAPGS